MGVTMVSGCRAVVATSLVLFLAVATGLVADVAASAVPAGGPHPPRMVSAVASVTGATAAAAAGRGGGVTSAASVPLTLRQEDFVPLSASECKRSRRQLVKAKRALVHANCADEADKAARLATLRAGISILRKAGRRSPPGIYAGDLEEVAAALSLADPHYLCALAPSKLNVPDSDEPPSLDQRSWSDTTVITNSLTCCADWSSYNDRCCFAACFDMSVLFPALLSLDYCCRLQQNTCERTHSCPSQVVYAVAP